MAGLTVLIPTLNEASNLPLLMADLRRWTHPLQLLVVDAGSQDSTRTGARLAGADVSMRTSATARERSWRMECEESVRTSGSLTSQSDATSRPLAPLGAGFAVSWGVFCGGPLP